MELTGQQLIGAPIDKTWVALNDPGVLKDCIAGCESIERTGDNEYAVAMAVRIGPVNAKFKGKLTLANIQPPNAYSINFEGQGGVAGFGKGSADVKLTPQQASTLLDYSARATVGGKIAQIGSRLVDAAAKKMADDFFTAFNNRIGSGAVATEVPAEPAGTTTEPAAAGVSTTPGPAAAAGPAGLPKWVWIVGAIIVAALIFTALR